ncbi:alkaline shock response membrane anchor protein AmaP [Kitasatospora sp. NPDC093679]|uniref:alkaline shock response membrane anchor protein AmaP n=1 Tax=Kitasatospora sp. NPDC093679 TaxID=3154983 RepID=UPI0034225B26
MRKRSTINRTLLALIGLTLLIGGLLVVMGSLDLYRRWHLDPPAGWPLTSPGDVLLPAADRTRYTAEDWWWPAVIGGLTVLTFLALTWLLIQVRRYRPRTLTAGASRPRHAVDIRNQALADAVAADTARLPAVDGARATITGTAGRPELHLHLTLVPGAEPATALNAVREEALANLAASTGWHDIPVHVRLRIAPHPARHID